MSLADWCWRTDSLRWILPVGSSHATLNHKPNEIAMKAQEKDTLHKNIKLKEDLESQNA